MSRKHQVADFNTLDDLLAHAANELGATHVAVELVRGTGKAGPGTKIYFPRGGAYPYEEARVWREGRYWHAEGPGARTGIRQPPNNAMTIERYLTRGGQRRAAEGRSDPLKQAKSAGDRYARDQIEGDHFREWTYDQIYEASRMDPSQVLPLKTKDDAKVIAENMMQQLGWDTKRELASFDIIEMIGAPDDTDEGAILAAFYEGFDEALHDPNVVDWLADEILLMHEQATGRTAEGAEEAKRKRHQDKLYTVAWVGGRKGPMTASDAVAFVQGLRQSWRESGRTDPIKIQVWYRDGSAVPYADLERQVERSQPREAREARRSGGKPFAGIDANERALNPVRNMLVYIILDGVAGVSPDRGHAQVPPEDADRYLERARRLLADFESQTGVPRGHAKRWMESKIDELRRKIADAEAVRSGERPQQMTPEDYERLRKHLHRETREAPRSESPPKRFKSAGGRTFTLGKMERTEPRFKGDSFWQEMWPIIYKGDPAGKLFRSEKYRAPLEWSATIRELYWKYASDAPTGVGFDVAAFATPQEALEAWGRSADQILDWSEGKPVDTPYGHRQRTKKSGQRERPREALQEQVVFVPTSDITTEPNMQASVAIDVQRLLDRGRYTSREQWAKTVLADGEPVELYEQANGELILGDGNHRFYAAKILGQDVPAIIWRG